MDVFSHKRNHDSFSIFYFSQLKVRAQVLHVHLATLGIVIASVSIISFDSSSWKYFICNSCAESCISPNKLNKMDKRNENSHPKQPVKLDNIDVTPILVALIIGFIAIGKWWPRHVAGQQQVGLMFVPQNTLQRFLSFSDDALRADATFYSLDSLRLARVPYLCSWCTANCRRHSRPSRRTSANTAVESPLDVWWTFPDIIVCVTSASSCTNAMPRELYSWLTLWLCKRTFVTWRSKWTEKKLQVMFPFLTTFSLQLPVHRVVW